MIAWLVSAARPGWPRVRLLPPRLKMALIDRSLGAPAAAALVFPVSEVLAMGQWQIYHWGLWTSHATSFPWQFDDYVAFYVLAGNAVVTPTGAWLLHRLLMLRPGDMVLLPRGFAATWQCFPTITLRWTRGETPPRAFAVGLPRELGDFPLGGLGQLGQPRLDPWALPAPLAAEHHTAAPGHDVAFPSGLPPLPVDPGPAYGDGPLAPHLSGHGLDAARGDGHPRPAGALASTGTAPPPTEDGAPPPCASGAGGSSRPSGPASGWLTITDAQGELHLWDTVTGRTSPLSSEVTSRGPFA